jgi:hypothetical protein
MLTSSQISTLQSQKAPSGGAAVQNGQAMNDQQFQQWVGPLTASSSQPKPEQTAVPSFSTPISEAPNAIKSLTDTTIQNTKNQQQSSFNAIGSDVSNAANDIQAGNTAFAQGKVGEGLKQTGKALVQGGLGTVSDAISYFLAPLSASVKTVTDTVSGTNPATGGLDISAIPAVQKLANGPVGDTMVSAQDSLTKAAAAHPVLAKALTDAFNVAMTAAGGGEAPKAIDQLGTGVSKDLTTVGTGIKAGATEASNIVSDVGTMAKNKVSSMMPEATPTEVTPLNEKMVLDNYNKFIKPSITGKTSTGKIARNDAQTISGLKAVYDNKANLSFTDSEGNVIKGESPKTVAQLSDAIGQTKASIYKQYNALAQQAGEKGISVDPVSIGTELSSVVNNKALKISNPDAISYAQGLQERLVNEGPIDAETAQQVIKNYNDELQSFYRNPTPGMASKVQIDAMVANRMRTQLDEGITNATGEKYQSLKNQYGSLSSMEATVAKRSASIAKQSKVGFSENLSNIASGVELARGLMTMNPVDIASSGAIKGIQLYQKYLNNPDTGISNIFKEFDRASTPSAPVVPKPEPQSFQPKSNTVQGIMNYAQNP